MQHRLTLLLKLIIARFNIQERQYTDKITLLYFKEHHNKIYETYSEEQKRFTIFQRNVLNIEQHNVRYENGEESYFMGVNQYADLTSEEFRKLLNFRAHNRPIGKYFERNANFIAPDSLDWREKGVGLDVRDQGDCGSSWAISAVSLQKIITIKLYTI